MGKPLSMDLRSRALAAVDEGMSCRAAATRFGVAAATVIRWHDQRRSTGSCAAKPQRGDTRSRRIEAHRETVLALHEARRILRPGGLAVMVDVVAPGDPASDTHLQAIELLRDPSHVRDYRVDEWSDALQKAGFQIRGLAIHDLPREFCSWVERMRTPKSHVDAILSLQDMASVSVRSALSIAKDGSFTIRVAMFELEVPPVP